LKNYYSLHIQLMNIDYRIFSYKNNIEISCKKNEHKQDIYCIHIVLYINYYTYYSCDKTIVYHILRYKSLQYNYFICLGLLNSRLKIYKDYHSRIRYVKLLIKLNEVRYYSYFIYNKYYKFVSKQYFVLNKSSMSSKKLFNCRDYYKIHSYI
jgi:hypothetical protein